MAKETAHQIGTPLSSLLGWIAILKMENINDKYVDEIEKDVHRLNTIANRFSKIGSLPTLKKSDVVASTKKAYEYLEFRSSNQISFSFESSQQEIYTNLNEELYSWVIENLIKNKVFKVIFLFEGEIFTGNLNPYIWNVQNQNILFKIREKLCLP